MGKKPRSVGAMRDCEINAGGLLDRDEPLRKDAGDNGEVTIGNWLWQNFFTMFIASFFFAVFWGASRGVQAGLVFPGDQTVSAFLIGAGHLAALWIAAGTNGGIIFMEHMIGAVFALWLLGMWVEPSPKNERGRWILSHIPAFWYKASVTTILISLVGATVGQFLGFIALLCVFTPTELDFLIPSSGPYGSAPAASTAIYAFGTEAVVMALYVGILLYLVTTKHEKHVPTVSSLIVFGSVFFSFNKSSSAFSMVTYWSAGFAQAVMGNGFFPNGSIDAYAFLSGALIGALVGALVLIYVRMTTRMGWVANKEAQQIMDELKTDERD